MLYQEQTLLQEVSLDHQVGAVGFVPWSLEKMEKIFRYSSHWHHRAGAQWQDRVRCPQWPYFVSPQADKKAGIPLCVQIQGFQGPDQPPIWWCQTDYYSYKLH